MKILIVNTADYRGGAAIAAFRLMKALRNAGQDARMLTGERFTADTGVTVASGRWRRKWNFIADRLPVWIANRFSRKGLFAVDVAAGGCDITRIPEFIEADVIHLHWINQGMLSMDNIQAIVRSGKPVVWTMHDMWPCTGICHHSRGCDNYMTLCHDCPQLSHPSPRDMAFTTFRRKEEIYHAAGSRMRFVACSRWLAGTARRSALLRDMSVTNIPNLVDTDIFAPRDKAEMRRRLRLPAGKKLLMFGAAKNSNKYKGIDYFLEACRIIAGNNPGLAGDIEVVMFGMADKETESMFPFLVHSLSYISGDEKVAEVYNAVDLFVIPSLEENLPNTIAESMACGVPCVGFATGGIPEMIDHLTDGYVAEYKSASDLATGIVRVLTDGDYARMSANARRHAVEAYSPRSVADRYISVYKEALGINPCQADSSPA